MNVVKGNTMEPFAQFANVFKNIKCRIDSFASHTRANVATIFAFAALPMVLITGSAIELVNVSKNKDLVQAAADAAVIDNVAYGRDVRTQGIEYAKNYLKSMLPPGLQLEDLSLEIEKGDSGTSVKLTAYASANAIVSGIIGKPKHSIKVIANATTGFSETEIVFAFDTTASMADDGKMAQLKESAKNLTAQLRSRSNNNIKVGVVPFNTMVKYTPSTTYNFIDYGYAQTTTGCLPVPDSNVCHIGWIALEYVCMHALDAKTCYDNARFWYIPTWQDADGTYHFRIEVHSHEPRSGSTYTYTTALAYDYRNSTCTETSSYTDETGTHTYCVASTGGVSEISRSAVSMALFGNDTTLKYYNRAPIPTMFQFNNSMKPSDDTKIPAYIETPNFITFGTSLAYGFAGPTAASNALIADSSIGIWRRQYRPSMPDQKEQWKGCIFDRNKSGTYNFDVDATPAVAPKSSTEISSLYTAKNCDSEPLATILPLTTDWNAIDAKIDELQPAGYTNLTIGIQQAMEVLSPTAPFTEGKAFGNTATNKIIILVTDGMNTRSRYTNIGPDLDVRTKMACDNAKALGITMYVVKLIEGDDELLGSCATILPYYFNLSSIDELNGAFQSILNSAGTTRLTK